MVNSRPNGLLCCNSVRLLSTLALTRPHNKRRSTRFIFATPNCHSMPNLIVSTNSLQKLWRTLWLVLTHTEANGRVKQHIKRANHYAVMHTNQSRRDVVFSPVDLMLLSTIYLLIPPSLTRKLAMKLLGPLPVIKQVGAVATT